MFGGVELTLYGAMIDEIRAENLSFSMVLRPTADQTSEFVGWILIVCRRISASRSRM
jgi:hypothetical protein